MKRYPEEGRIVVVLRLFLTTAPPENGAKNKYKLDGPIFQ